MKQTGILILFSLFFNMQAQTTTKQPNIIFIIADDVSANDIGVYGTMNVLTPNINRLAEKGVCFKNYYVAASSCSPSRSSIITGRYPHNTGAAELHTGVPPSLPLFPEELKKAGYYTALLGKWHEGQDTQRAYDTIIAGPKLNGNGGEEKWLSMLNALPTNKPFFLWLAPFDAHRDWTTDVATTAIDPYKLEIFNTLLDDEETRKDLAAYYAEIARLDYNVGLLIAELEKLHLIQNTIIVFTADNARPFPGAKTRLYDRGLQSPLIVNWPGSTTIGKISNALVSAVDLAPTLLTAAHANIPASFQGKSFISLLKQPDLQFRNYVFGEHNWHDYEAYERSVRTASYLYIYNGRPMLTNTGAIDVNQSPAAKSLYAAFSVGKLTKLQGDPFVSPRPTEELYDVVNDPLQQNNVAKNLIYSKTLKELRTILQLWQFQTEDTQPSNLTPDWYDRLTGKPLPAKGQRKSMPGGQAAIINYFFRSILN